MLQPLTPPEHISPEAVDILSPATPTGRSVAESIHDAPKQIACEDARRAGEVTVAAGRQTKSFVDLDDDV